MPELTTPSPTGSRSRDCDPGTRRRRDWLVLAAVIVVVALQVALSLWGILSAADLPRGWVIALDVAVGIASCALVPALYRSPVATAVVAAALAVGSTTAIPVSTIATVRVARARPPGTAVLVAGLGVIGHALRALWRSADGANLGWWVALVIAIQMALYVWGAHTRIKDQQIGALRERAERGEAEQRQQVADAREAERARIAREMHDVLAHRLSMVATFAGALEFRDDADPEQQRKAVGVVRENAHQALEDLREVIWVLRADEGDVAEEGRRPQPAVADLSALVAESRDAGVEVTLHGSVPNDIPATLGRTIYRVVQEGLTNARKHAAGTPVRVVLAGCDDGWRVEVSNPRTAVGLSGSDMIPGAGIPGAGAGLIGLAERVELAHGRFRYGPEDDRFVVSAWLPLRSGLPGAAAHRR